MTDLICFFRQINLTLSTYTTYVCIVKGVEGKIGKTTETDLKRGLREITVRAGRKEEEERKSEKGNKLRGNGLYNIIHIYYIFIYIYTQAP